MGFYGRRGGLSRRRSVKFETRHHNFSFPLDIEYQHPYNRFLVVLGGELAVPYTRNPLYAGPNSLLRVMPQHFSFAGRPPRNRRSRTSSGPEGSSAISDAVCVADRSRPQRS